MSYAAHPHQEKKRDSKPLLSQMYLWNVSAHQTGCPPNRDTAQHSQVPPGLLPITSNSPLAAPKAGHRPSRWQGHLHAECAKPCRRLSQSQA